MTNSFANNGQKRFIVFLRFYIFGLFDLSCLNISPLFCAPRRLHRPPLLFLLLFLDLLHPELAQ